jgi:hypothetical protein
MKKLAALSSDGYLASRQIKTPKKTFPSFHLCQRADKFPAKTSKKTYRLIAFLAENSRIFQKNNP